MTSFSPPPLLPLHTFRVDPSSGDAGLPVDEERFLARARSSRSFSTTSEMQAHSTGVNCRVRDGR